MQYVNHWTDRILSSSPRRSSHGEVCSAAFCLIVDDVDELDQVETARSMFVRSLSFHSRDIIFKALVRACKVGGW